MSLFCKHWRTEGGYALGVSGCAKGGAVLPLEPACTAIALRMWLRFGLMSARAAESGFRRAWLIASFQYI